MAYAWRWLRSLVFAFQAYAMMALMAVFFTPWALVDRRGDLHAGVDARPGGCGSRSRGGGGLAVLRRRHGTAAFLIGEAGTLAAGLGGVTVDAGEDGVGRLHGAPPVLGE
jgi:hypothetical protein